MVEEGAEVARLRASPVRSIAAIARAHDLILSPKPVIAILPGEQPRQPTPRR